MSVRIHVDVDDLLATFTAAYSKVSNYGEIALRRENSEDGSEARYWIEPGGIQYWHEGQKSYVEAKAESYAKLTDIEPAKAMLVISENGFEFKLRPEVAQHT